MTILYGVFVSPGEPDYPSVDKSDIVIRTVINNIARAFPLAIVSSHEIANVQFGPADVAAGY